MYHTAPRSPQQEIPVGAVKVTHVSRSWDQPDGLTGNDGKPTEADSAFL